MKDVRGMSLEEMTAFLTGLGEQGFRAKQVYGWVTKGVASFEEMLNLPKSLIEKLRANAIIDNCKIIKTVKSSDGTIKTLSELSDGALIESVFMSYKHGFSACLSTQVGCRMQCTFCASTLGGMVRHLTPAEYMGQIYALQKMSGERISNIVLMGSGEPLDNFDATAQFLALATDERGLNLSARNITLSTCGLVPEIKRLADLGYPITLAISLHNPFQEERKAIMPISKRYPIESLLEAVDYYVKTTGRRVTFEYALINGVNDSIEHAKALGALLKGKLVHVNLIPINAVSERAYLPSEMTNIQKFKQVLSERYTVTTTIRRELGSDINAACGQLRNEHR